MAKSPRGPLLETSALIVGYAMSRLDQAYLDARGLGWTKAFDEASQLLGVPVASIKNLRDEFDPFHDNSRQGWHGRPMRKERQRIMGELCDVSDAALLAMVDAILRKDPEALTDVVEPLSQPSTRVSNPAERLLTGRRAEDYFREHCQQIAGFLATALIDHRELLRGYDFAVQARPDLAIEIKGLKRSRGNILFTDREWTEAKTRRQNYWLVVIGNLEREPAARLVTDPTEALDAKCQYQTTIAASWRAVVAVT